MAASLSGNRAKREPQGSFIGSTLLGILGSAGPLGPCSPTEGSLSLDEVGVLNTSVPLFSSRQVASQCQLLQASLGRPSSPQLPQLPDEPMSLQDAPAGVFQMPPGDPFPERVTVVWLSVLALAFALVCEPQENLSLAEITLRRLAPRLLLSLRLLGPGADVLLRPDAADGLLDRLLPHGQMLFLNERFLQAMDRELGLKVSR